jgi:hypothetical protein
MSRPKEFKIEWDQRFDHSLRSKLIKYYKKGYDIRELCIMFDADLSTVLEIIKRKKIKKRETCKIFEKQEIRKDKSNLNFIRDKEYLLLEKYFISFSKSEVINTYFWYWQEKLKKDNAKKEKCNHSIRHIRCSKCNKILADASNIVINPSIKSKIR